MSNNLTGAIVYPILTVMAKAVIRAERYKDMNIDDIKSYLYKIQGKFRLVHPNQSDKYIQAIIETYYYLKKMEHLNVEKLQINRSAYYMYKNNDDLFNSNIRNPILDEELIQELYSHGYNEHVA